MHSTVVMGSLWPEDMELSLPGAGPRGTQTVLTLKCHMFLLCGNCVWFSVGVKMFLQPRGLQRLGQGHASHFSASPDTPKLLLTRYQGQWDFTQAGLLGPQPPFPSSNRPSEFLFFLTFLFFGGTRSLSLCFPLAAVRGDHSSCVRGPFSVLWSTGSRARVAVLPGLGSWGPWAPEHSLRVGAWYAVSSWPRD